MKRKGSYFEYEQDRNEELMKAYHKAIASCKIIRLENIWQDIADMPASRFWVSEERAAIVVSRMLKGDTLKYMRTCKREMFFEIYEKVLKLQQQKPDLSIYKLCFIAVNQPAKKFYMTPLSIRETIYKIKRDFYKERKRKLKFVMM